MIFSFGLMKITLGDFRFYSKLPFRVSAFWVACYTNPELEVFIAVRGMITRTFYPHVLLIPCYFSFCVYLVIYLRISKRRGGGVIPATRLKLRLTSKLKNQIEDEDEDKQR